jgi:outer membrane protein assembly factor BamD (BamD/ComL family)
MRRWLLVPLALVLASCAAVPKAPPAPPAAPRAAPPDAGEGLVRLAESWAESGSHDKAVALFQEVAKDPSSPVADRALLGLTRSLCNPEYAEHDYRQAFLVADRLVREYPASQYAVEARAWRELLLGYLASSRELERRTMELEQTAIEQERQTQELERLKRVDAELERRTQELERLKRLDLELEQRKRKP